VKEVQPIYAERFRFFVVSEKAIAQRYLVDLEEHGGHGACGCPHFQMRLRRDVEEGIRNDNTMCKHLKKAHIYFSKHMISMILKQAQRHE
jgi:hypothetical protein